MDLAKGWDRVFSPLRDLHVNNLSTGSPFFFNEHEHFVTL